MKDKFVVTIGREFGVLLADGVYDCHPRFFSLCGLVVQKAVHLENSAGLHFPVAEDALFKKLHIRSPMFLQNSTGVLYMTRSDISSPI